MLLYALCGNLQLPTSLSCMQLQLRTVGATGYQTISTRTRRGKTVGVLSCPTTVKEFCWEKGRPFNAAKGKGGGGGGGMSPKRVEKKGVVEGGALTPPPPPPPPSQSRPQRNNTIPPPASAPSLPASLRRCQGTEERAKKHLANGQYYYHFRVAAASREGETPPEFASLFSWLLTTRVGAERK